MAKYGLKIFLANLSDSQQVRWDGLLESGKSEAEARSSFPAEEFAKRLPSPLLADLVRLAELEGPVAASSAQNSGDAHDYQEEGWPLERLLVDYWDAVHHSSALDKLEDEANEFWRNAFLRAELLRYLCEESFTPSAIEHLA